jgi:predicted peptidase
MRTPTKLLAAMLLLAAISLPAQDADNMNKREHFKQQVTRTVELGYLLYLPKEYNAQSGQRWPLMFFLHGAGERGTNLSLVTKHGPPKLVARGTNFPFILVSPQCPTDQRWDNDAVMALLDDVIARHKVDTNRVYLTGLSMGGFGSWSLAARHPERFAAVAPICGGGERIDVMLAGRRKKDALSTLGVWAFHGAKDPTVPLEESQKMVAAFKKAGCQEVELTVYPEAGHDSWTEAYNNPKLFEWFLAHTRGK